MSSRATAGPPGRHPSAPEHPLAARIQRRTPARRAVVAVLTVLLVFGWTASARSGALPQTTGVQSASAATPVPLRILLTNDDGWNATGIQIMKSTLESAGHQVTLVAPATNRSGSSVAFTADFFTQIDVIQQAPSVWSVAGTPADAALVGLRVIMKDAPPDLVISGANFGQNVGRTTNSSGTVGAAIMASQLDKPAIAVSVGVDPTEFGQNFPSTFSAMPRASQLTVNLIKELQKTSSSATTGLLPSRQVLNVNYPAKATANIAGIAHTTMGRTLDVVPKYAPAGPGKYTIVPELRNDADDSNSDTTKFRANYITITPLDGNWSAESSARTAIFFRLWSLKVV